MDILLEYEYLTLQVVVDKFFTPHGNYFIGNSHYINKLWILKKNKKPPLKPKRAHNHKMTLKPIV